MMKKTGLLLGFLLCLVLAGCRGEEMERFFIVTAMAVDPTPEGYRLTLEGSADQVDENKNPKAVLRQGEGRDLTQCFLDIQQQTGEYPYTRQTELILLSSALPPEPLRHLVDDLLNENGVRLNARVAMTEGQAGTLLKDGTFASQRILKAVAKGGGTLTSADVMLCDLAYTRSNEGIDPILPITAETRTEGLWLLRQESVAGRVDSALTPIFMMAGGTERGGSITVDTAEGPHAFKLLHNEGRIRAVPADGGVEVTVSVRAEFRAADRLTADAALYEEVLRCRLEADLMALTALLQAKGCDALGFGQALARRYPGVWADLRDNWPEHFSGCRVVPDIHVTITSTGKLRAG